MGFVMFFMALLYFYNAWQYNPYWGYDGGAHIDYIFTIAESNRLPTMSENYLAWHEPVFYLFNGALVKLFSVFLDKAEIIKLLQLASAVWGILFFVGSGLLSWLIAKNRWLTIFTLLFVGLLGEVSEASRFISNEIFFQTLVIWWLVWFWHWRMFETESWSWRRWIFLIAGLALLLWIKLTAVVLVLSILLWLLLVAARNRSGKPLVVGGLAIIICGLSFLPWLVYKQRNFNAALTINNFEKINENRMSAEFYLRWDDGIFSYPFWRAGTKSFWSMLYADSFGDYYNVFQNFDAGLTTDKTTTINGRQVDIGYMERLLFLYWWSVPLVVIVLFGWLIGLTRRLLKRNFDGVFVLYVFCVGLLLALAYNVYQYPFLERGTMKAIFILAFFPLVFLLGMTVWADLIKNWRYKKTAALLWSVYFLLWLLVSLSVDLLPSV